MAIKKKWSNKLVWKKVCESISINLEPKMFHLWSNFFYKNKHGKFFPLSQDFLIWPLQTNVTFYLDPPMSVGTLLPIQILWIPRDHNCVNFGSWSQDFCFYLKVSESVPSQFVSDGIFVSVIYFGIMTIVQGVFFHWASP